MNHLNYFAPYDRKKATHEDQLTRAFLTLLRLSPSALFATYDMIRGAVAQEAATKGVSAHLRTLAELDLVNVELETQPGTLPAVNEYVSVLISNDKPKAVVDVQISARTARYDGVIAFGQKLALVIENKPRQENVWVDQLNLSDKDVPSDSTIVPVVARLSWRELVVMITQLMQHPAVGGAEKLLMHDLLDFINTWFPYLNPFHQFGLCNDNGELIDLRIEAILKEVAGNDELVKYARGWAYYIQMENQPGIQRIGLVNENWGKPNWQLKLFVGFADTVHQARQFYTQDLDLSRIAELRAKKWVAAGNFHLSHMQLHLLWYSTKDERVADYLQYWKANPELISQHASDEIDSLLNTLFLGEVLVDKPEQRIELQNQVHSTKRSRINVGPGFVLAYVWNKEEAVKLDKEGVFAEEIRSKIIEAFSIVRSIPTFLKTAAHAKAVIR